MYLLDANVFMEASRLYYAFDIAPGFWDWLRDDTLIDQVGSVVAIKDEITSGKGDLVSWATALPATFWMADDDDVVRAMTELAGWSNDPARNFLQPAVDEFMSSADLRLIAHAMVHDATVVTREQPAPDARKKIKIPDVCRAFDVDWVGSFDAYRHLGLTLRNGLDGDE